MIRFKIDVLKELKAIGYSSTRLRDEKILGESTMSLLRKREAVRPASLDVLCRLLGCQPGMLIEYVPDDEKAIEKHSKA